MTVDDELMEYVQELLHHRRTSPESFPVALPDSNWPLDQMKHLLNEYAEAIEKLDKRVRELEDGRVVLLEKIVATLAKLR